MALKGRVKDINTVEEKFRDLYVKADDGDYVLDADGLVPKERVDEFRTNNINLSKTLEAMTEKYKDIDPEEVKRLRDEAKKLAERKAIDEGKIDEVVAERVTTVRAGLEGEIAKEKQRADKLQQRLEVVLIDSELARAAAEAGVKRTAIHDVVRRGRDIFRLIDDVVRPVGEDGKTIYSKKDGITAMPISEWLAGLVEEAPHLFEQAQGSGANNGGGGGGATVKARSELKTAKEKSDYIGKYGQDAYLNLPA